MEKTHLALEYKCEDSWKIVTPLWTCIFQGVWLWSTLLFMFVPAFLICILFTLLLLYVFSICRASDRHDWTDEWSGWFTRHPVPWLPLLLHARTLPQQPRLWSSSHQTTRGKKDCYLLQVSHNLIYLIIWHHSWVIWFDRYVETLKLEGK